MLSCWGSMNRPVHACRLAQKKKVDISAYRRRGKATGAPRLIRRSLKMLSQKSYTRTDERRNRSYRSVTVHVIETANMGTCANVSVNERQAIRLCGVLKSKHCTRNVLHSRQVIVVRHVTQLALLSARECFRKTHKHIVELQQSQCFVQGVTSVLLFLSSILSS